MTTERLPLRIDSTGGRTVRTSCANSSSSSAMRSGSALVTDTIGGRSPSTEMPRRRATSVPAVPISCASASSSTSLAPLAASASTASTPCEWPATATAGVAVRSMPLAAQRAHSGDLGQQHARHGDGGRRQVLGGGHGLLAGQRADPVHRLEPDRTHHDQLARHRLEQELGLADQRRQLGLDTGRGHQFLQGLQPGAALAAERDGVGLAGIQTIDKCVAGLRRSVTRLRPVETLSCSLIVTSRYLLSPAWHVSRRTSSSLGCRCLGGVTWLPCGSPTIRRRIPTGSTHRSADGREPDRPADTPAVLRVS